MEMRRLSPPCLQASNSYSNGKRITNMRLMIVSTRTKSWQLTINSKTKIGRRRKTLSKLSLIPT